MFFAIALLVLAAGAAAAWWCTVRAARLPRRWSRLLTAGIVAATALVPAVLPLAWSQPRSDLRPWTWTAYTWMGLLFYLVLLGLATRLVAWAWSRRGTAATDPGRRLFLHRAAAAAAAVGASAVSAWGLRSASELVVEEVEVPLRRLPPELDGFRIVQISDLHLGPLDGSAFLERVVQRCNALRPDLVAITGDVVDGPVDRIAADVAPLGTLRSTHGSFLVTGNHEYYSGVAAWLAEFERLGVRALANERVAIAADEGGGFDLAGVHDFRGGAFGPEHAPDLSAAMAERDPARPCVLLAHQPAHVELAAAHGVDLMLSGHTHGGQLWPFGALTRLVQPYLAGTHLHDRRTWIHVNRGTGCWGPPMRVGAPAEITLMKLRPAPA